MFMSRRIDKCTQTHMNNAFFLNQFLFQTLLAIHKHTHNTEVNKQRLNYRFRLSAVTLTIMLFYYIVWLHPQCNAAWKNTPVLLLISLRHIEKRRQCINSYRQLSHGQTFILQLCAEKLKSLKAVEEEKRNMSDQIFIFINFL